MSDETKLLLSARRPGGHDDADPAIAEALARAKGARGDGVGVDQFRGDGHALAATGGQNDNNHQGDA